MNNKRFQNIIKNRWLRATLSLTLAFFIAIIILAFPVSIEMNRLETSDGFIDVSLMDVETIRAANGLTITKFTEIDIVDQGSFITYTLRVVNQTDDSLDGLSVVDDVPTNTSCLEDDGGEIFDGTDTSGGMWGGNQASCDGGSAVWLYLSGANNGNTFDDGESVELIYRVFVAGPLPDQSEIINPATYHVVVLSDDSYNDVGQIPVTTIVNAPLWEITKSATPQIVEPGGVIVYEINVENIGHLVTEGTYTITDQIPSFTDFASASDGGDFDTIDEVTWVLSDTLDINESRSVFLTVTVTSPLTDDTSIINQGYSVTGGNVFSDDVGVDVPVTVNSPVTLTLTKDDNADFVQAGGTILYTLNVTNDPSSTGPAENVVVTDNIPANTTLLDADFVGLVNGNVITSLVDVTWTISDSIPVGDSVQMTMAVDVDTPLPSGTTITNNYDATADDLFAPVDTLPVTTTVVSTPTLNIIKTANPETVEAGGTLTYTITYSNSGNADATNVVVTDTLDSKVVYVTSNPPGNHDGSPSGGDVVWNVGTVDGESAESGILTVTVTVTEPLPVNSMVTNTVQIGAAEGVTESTTLMTMVNSGPDLEIEKEAPDVVAAGELLTYTLTISNIGNAEALNTVLEDAIPLNTTFVTGTPGFNPGSPLPGDPITWTVGTLALNDPQVYTFVVRIDTPLPDGTEITNVATAGSDIDEDISNTVTTTVTSEPSLVIAKVGQPQTVQAGGLLTYTIRYTNTGNADATDVLITDTFPAQSSYNSDSSAPDISATGTAIPGGRRWLVNDIAGAGGGGVITLTLDVESPQDAGTELLNRVDIKTETPIVTGDAATATNVITSTPILEIEKIASEDTIKAGQELVYTIIYTNTGNANANNVNIIDLYEGESDNVEASGSGAVITSLLSAQVIWIFDSVPADGVQKSQTITVTVPDTLAEGTVLTNSVTITSLDGATDSDTITTTVRALEADLAINKERVGAGVVFVGDPITYTLTITNNGPDTVDAVITDTFGGSVVVDNIINGDCTSGNPLICTLTDFDGTQTITVILNTTAPSTVTNSAEISPTNNALETDATDNTADADDVTVRFPEADLTITKTRQGTGDVIIGNPITYTLTITNNGPDPLDAVITDTFENAVDMTSEPGCTTGSNPVICTVTDFTGTRTITIILDTTLSVSGTITNSAEIAPTSDGRELDDTDNTSEVLTDTVRFPRADLTIAKTRVGTGTVIIGDPITYRLTISNSELDPVTAIVTDTFANATFDSFSFVPDYPGGNCTSPLNGPVVCTLPNFTNDDTPQFIDIVLGTSASSPSAVVTNVVAISSTAEVIELNPDNNDAVGPDVSLRLREADLSITKTRVGTGTVIIDAPITYTLTITNAGPDSVTAIVTDTFTNAGFGAVSVAPPFDSASCTPGAGQLVCSLDNFTGSTTITVVLDTATSISGTLVTNSAEITATDPITRVIEPDPDNNDDAAEPVEVRLPQADVQIAKVAEAAEVVDGSLITYTIVVTNNGPDVVDVILTDTFGTDLVTFAACSDGCSGTGPVTWAIEQLTGVRTFELILRAKFGISGTLTNQVDVEIVGFGVDTSPGDNSDSEDVFIRFVPKLVYLPLVFKNFAPPTPTPTPTTTPETPTATPPPGATDTPTPPPVDLVIEDFFITPASPGASDDVVVTIILRNNGTQSTGEGFWTDFYVNPNPDVLPNDASLGRDRGWFNPTINSLKGIAWAVPELGPGQAITLTSDGSAGGLAPSGRQTAWDAPQLPPGSYALYSFVDSFDQNDPTGEIHVEIVESNEANNMAGPITVDIISGSDAAPVSTPEPINIEPRPDLGNE